MGPRRSGSSSAEPGSKRGRIAAEIADTFRAGAVPSDRVFDKTLTRRLRAASPVHWTPLEVVARVARWIDEREIRTVVDIGSGAGKFCVAAALMTRSRYVGIEHRPWLVDAASRLAASMGVGDRVAFSCCALGDAPLPPADAYYLFNPFGENLFDGEETLAADVDLGLERYRRDVIATKAAFDAAPEGTFAIVYNGFGGRMPPRYGEVDVDRALPNVLRLWRKQCCGASATPPVAVTGGSSRSLEES